MAARADSAHRAGDGVDALLLALLTAVITAVLAYSVLQAPTERIFGMPIVGRHHDPFTVIAQFDGAPVSAAYRQPITDAPGRLVARFAGGVAAYNAIVLLSFPLAALSAFLFARQLNISKAGAAFAGLAFAFAPFHIAQAAYHPHIAQVEWIPLFLLALWRCLDRPSAVNAALVAAISGATVLSNFYGGLIAAVTAPALIAAYAFVYRQRPDAWRNALVTSSVLLAVASAGLAYELAFAPSAITNRAAFAFPLAEVARYSATPLSFVIPPIAHPLFGETARRFWETTGVREGLLEQQVFLGWSLIALALVAIGHWSTRATEVSVVPILATLVAVGVFFAMSPPRWLYTALPMFRAYARFGVVIQLATALCAGIGFDVLRRNAVRGVRTTAALLAVLLAGEYAVSPMAMSRDVLPTRAHRWVADQPASVRALDCVALTPETSTIGALSGNRIVIGGADTDCSEPEFAQKLAAGGYTHLLIRRDSVEDRMSWPRSPIAGTRIAAAFADAEVLAISVSKPPVYTMALAGFSPRERDASWSWRWMGSTAIWVVKNTAGTPMVTSLELELSAFYHPRHLEILLDGRSIATLEIQTERQRYQIGPVTLTAGDHALLFRAAESATVAATLIHNADARPLSFAFGSWHWTAAAR